MRNRTQRNFIITKGGYKCRTLPKKESEPAPPPKGDEIRPKQPTKH